MKFTEEEYERQRRVNAYHEQGQRITELEQQVAELQKEKAFTDSKVQLIFNHCLKLGMNPVPIWSNEANIEEFIGQFEVADLQRYKDAMEWLEKYMVENVGYPLLLSTGANGSFFHLGSSVNTPEKFSQSFLEAIERLKQQVEKSK